MTWRVSASPPRKPPAANRWQPAQPSHQTQPLGTISILYPNPNAVKPFSKPILGISKIRPRNGAFGCIGMRFAQFRLLILGEHARLWRPQACGFPLSREWRGGRGGNNGEEGGNGGFLGGGAHLVRIRIYGIMGFSGFSQARVFKPQALACLSIFGLAGFSVVAKSAIRAKAQSCKS